MRSARPVDKFDVIAAVVPVFVAALEMRSSADYDRRAGFRDHVVDLGEFFSFMRHIRPRRTHNVGFVYGSNSGILGRTVGILKVRAD